MIPAPALSRSTVRTLHDAAFVWVKRGMDATAGAVGLVLALPVLVLCGLWIKLSDGGPVLYRQWRVGREGWLFRIYKLRTMRLDAESQGVRFSSANDQRILRGCGWMRRSHMDELPQLWNILRGEMSLVGPRPERPEVFENLRPTLPQLERRLAGPPGLTGLAQVTQGYANDLPGMRRKLASDLRYLRRKSLRRELSLLLRTLPKFWDRSAL